MIGSRSLFAVLLASASLSACARPTATCLPQLAEESASSPSLAVLSGTLYLAHRWGQTAEIVMQHMPTGGAWSAVQHIPAGAQGANLQGNDVQLAVVNGYLHLIHHRFNDSNDYWWTYNRGCDAFAPEVTVPYVSQAYFAAPPAPIRSIGGIGGIGGISP